MARAIYKELEPLTPSVDRSVKESCNHFGPGKPLYELAYTGAPAALIEVAFHDNPDDAAWIVSSIEPIGIALAKGILNYFGITYKEDNPNKLYRVQVGAYSIKENAEAMLSKIKAAGFKDAFIKHIE